MMEVVQTHIIPSEEFIDDDVLRAMNSLGCFKDKEKLKTELLQPLHNTGNCSTLGDEKQSALRYIKTCKMMPK